MTQIIVQTYRVLDEFSNYSAFKKLQGKAKLILINCRTEIKQFKIEKKKYDEIMTQGGSYHPDYKKTIKAFSNAKSLLYKRKEVENYFQLEKEIQKLLDELVGEITKAVSNYIKVGFANKGGSCNVC